MKEIMNSNFKIITDGEESIPEVYINGKKLAVKSLTYSFSTKTESYGGHNELLVYGYLKEETYKDGTPKTLCFEIDYVSGLQKRSDVYD